jgi:hypothetical protein
MPSLVDGNRDGNVDELWRTLMDRERLTAFGGVDLFPLVLHQAV